MKLWEEVKTYFRIMFPWRADEHNPYIRHCKWCGQQQGAFGLDMAGPGVWHDFMPVKQKTPRCCH